MPLIETIQDNFRLGNQTENIGKAFVFNFATATVLSGGNVAVGVMTGGYCALATAISAVVKPVFMGLVGYSWNQKPSAMARFSNNMVVLTVHALLIGSYRGAYLTNWFGTALIAGLTACMETGSAVKDPQLFCRVPTILALYLFSKV